jgi:predicted Rossmann fold flavoprotein
LKNLSEKTIAVVGTGPAGLMAAYVLASAGIQVTLFEKRKSSGRKLLIAGSSGLNISYDCPEETLFEHYRGPKEHFQNLFKKFSRSQWIAFVESLGLETFKGTSRRYFVREMKASGLLKAWTEKLKSLGVKFEFQKELTGFDVENGKAKVFFNQSPETFDAVCFCLGGGSWEPDESPLRWPKAFTEKSIAFTPFQSSNAGFEVAWPEAFLKEAEGKPIKSIVLTTAKGNRKGELNSRLRTGRHWNRSSGFETRFFRGRNPREAQSSDERKPFADQTRAKNSQSLRSFASPSLSSHSAQGSLRCRSLSSENEKISD